MKRQDFLNAVTQDIDLVRGDVMTFNFQLAGLGTQANYEALTIKFGVAEHYEEEAVIEVTNGSGIELEDYNSILDIATFSVCVPSDLNYNLAIMRYYYDLKIVDDEEVYTLMRGRYNVLYDVEERG